MPTPTPGRVLREYLGLGNFDRKLEWDALNVQIIQLVREVMDLSASSPAASHQLDKVLRIRNQIIRDYPHYFPEEKELTGGKLLRQHIMMHTNALRYRKNHKKPCQPSPPTVSPPVHQKLSKNTKARACSVRRSNRKTSRTLSYRYPIRDLRNPGRTGLGKRIVRVVDPMTRTTSNNRSEERKHRTPRRLTPSRLVPFVELPLRNRTRNASSNARSQRHQGTGPSASNSGREPRDDLNEFLLNGCRRPLTSLYPFLQRYGCKTMDDIRSMAGWPLTMIRGVMKDIMKSSSAVELQHISEMDWDLLAHGIWQIGRMVE
ncbi:hypothetical protein BDN72DRAFT_845611 [Pluteus cervinus]|uniref:Uncharacterized protein n=1 Tax=Pluteus cervinus TaxID=181527 RepID=A0ACD3AHM2_9AGAR|nr:hypothetical protein BDN72DRAFT_845611 [Pluteus cervinus]